MSHKYLRMTIDVAVFEGGDRVFSELTKKSERSSVPTGDGKSDVRFRYHTWGTGEQLARRFMERVKSGDIEIDDIRDVEDHTD